MKLWKKILVIVMSLVFVGGLIYALYPWIYGTIINEQNRSDVAFFESVYPKSKELYEEEKIEEEIKEAVADSVARRNLYPDLYRAMQQYNRDIYQNRQALLGDAWTYVPSDFDLEQFDLPTDIVAIVRVPSLNIEKPMFLGASDEHLDAGCAQLCQTSMPVGGNNVNTVIAGHCGLRGAEFFKRLQDAEVGDPVFIRTLWGTLVYKVAEVKIIEPNDIDAIRIQEGRDLVTLLTCHPYASGGRYRCLVIAERVKGIEAFTLLAEDIKNTVQNTTEASVQK